MVVILYQEVKYIYKIILIGPVLNKKGELIGFIHEKIKNKTAIIPSEYFKGI